MFTLWRILHKQHRRPSKSTGSMMIITGVFMVLASMGMLMQPYYTSAEEKPTVDIWLRQEWLGGSPERGEPGDLYDQLVLTVSHRENILYQGPMSGLDQPFSVTEIIGPVTSGQNVIIDFFVDLPGPETGNEFQGSYLSTSMTVLTACTWPEEEGLPCIVTVSPEESLFNLQNLNPGDRYTGSITVSLWDEITVDPEEPGGDPGSSGKKKDEEKEITIDPELPGTGETQAFLLTLFGFLMIFSGIILKRMFRNKGEGS
ncbi:LPXTG cell wall anchor domain-containing protein [Candidatus Contubernalis alkaliaceticus]|uniref:LPXTG cell wall anchor domain-containing protein n=1 Tax=Candidatus Contubernalis alkaliaceticus TaxID=338645 RepID=UPI001F4BE3B5|nr:LPXTG cell wall anchor domain-containing protein [Candidatus Contubernalis alkalaceticus]UNC93466.1 LPXTG cell wall anchor domain-containing protein [Candidatus Contubernalis alkalaceticus]